MGNFLADSEIFKGSPNSTQGKKAWSASGTLYTPGVGAVGNGFGLQADFVENPGYYTVQFTLDYPTVPAPFAAPVIRALAEVGWSVEGTTNRRLLHVTSGAVISGAGQGVVVKLIDDSIVVDEPFPPGLKYQAHITLVKGNRPQMAGNQPPIYQPTPTGSSVTILADQLGYEIPAGTGTGAGPGVVSIDVPQNAGINSVLFCVAPIQGDLPLTAAQLAQITLNTSAGTFDGNRLGTWIPIPPGSDAVSLVNYTNQDFTGTIVFGVEG